MSSSVEYLFDKATAEQIYEHLMCCDADFVPALSSRVEIKDYANKIVNKAIRFEAWLDNTMVGLVAAYCNDQEGKIAYITSASVLRAWTGNGIAMRMINQCIEHVKELGMVQINLQVASENTPAIRLYEKSGFTAGKANVPFVSMSLYLKNGEMHEQQA